MQQIPFMKKLTDIKLFGPEALNTIGISFGRETDSLFTSLPIFEGQ